MKPSLSKRILCAGGLVSLGMTAMAVPLQRADVPAEPTWVLHVDCDMLRPSAVGQYLLAEMDKPDAQAKFAVFQTLFNFDPRKQLHGLTLYSSGTTSEDGVLLVYADFDPERLVTLAKAANDSQNTTHNQHVIYNWIDDKKKAKNGVKPRTYASIQGTHVVILAQQEARVAQALDVLDRAKSSLSSSFVFPKLGLSGNTSFIEGAARKLDLPESTPNAAIFRLAKSLSLQIGESSRQATAKLIFEANDEDVAKQVAMVAQGLIALTKLQKEKPEAAMLADALLLKQDGVSVVATLTMPAADVINVLKSGAEKEAQKKAERN
ncbi:MAG: hypothetical protein WCT12_15000 [Verrucomicrobiota bacterium]